MLVCILNSQLQVLVLNLGFKGVDNWRANCRVFVDDLLFVIKYFKGIGIVVDETNQLFFKRIHKSQLNLTSIKCTISQDSVLLVALMHCDNGG